MAEASTRTKTLLEREARHSSGLWQPDLVLERGQGALIWDTDGNEYIDCLAGIAVASVGHGNARLAAAISEQAGRLVAFAQNIATEPRVAFTEKLFEFLPDTLNRVFLTNSGSEANEAALKWARVATGRTRFVAAVRGFSGRTLGSLALTWEKKYREPFQPLPYEPDFIPYNDIDRLDRAVTEETAGVFLEPIQGEGGIRPADKAFLESARQLTKERGALFIVDEIQTGVGRTGRFLAGDHYGIKGDMVTLAKGLGGGMPIGALVMTDDVAAAMPKGGHGTTFGGNALACAAGLAVLTEIEQRELMRHAGEVGAHFKSRLKALGSPLIREVRGMGLMLGVELKGKAAPYIKGLREHGVLTINAGSNVIRFVPPLVITREQVDEVVARFGRVLESAAIGESAAGSD